MAYDAGTDARQTLWSELSETLQRLEALALCPVEELGGAARELQRLQYALHLLAERFVGVRPPPSTATAHAELTDALASARDATAELAEAAQADGAEGAAPLVYAWRGALFRVRLARMLLAPARPRLPTAEPDEAELDEAEPDEAAGPRAALTAFGLTLGGAAAFVSGAVLATWPLWTLGMLAVVAGFLAYRP
jgi:hypothetical protein